jgi:hypothetical protein
MTGSWPASDVRRWVCDEACFVAAECSEMLSGDNLIDQLQFSTMYRSKSITGCVSWCGTTYLPAAIAFVLSLIALSLPASEDNLRTESRGGQRARIVITPARVELTGPRASRQILVTAIDREGRETDLTHVIKWSSNSPVFEVDARGLVVARQDGTGQLSLRIGGSKKTVDVIASQTTIQRPVSFQNEVVPVLSAAGCSDIRCHGAPGGKDGFRLSLWGSKPQFDFMQLTRDAVGRRTNALDPDQSLLLQKPLNRLPHVGGKRFQVDDHLAELLRNWQQQGLVYDADTSGLSQLNVAPAVRVLHAPAMAQQLAVVAAYEDGTREDVTRITTFQSSDVAIAEVDRGGFVQFHQQGEVAILCRYMGQLVSIRLMHIAQPEADYRWSSPRTNNFVDQHVFAKLQMLNLTPSPVASDQEFVRRVYLDLCGILPSPAAAAAFVNSSQHDKRERLIDHLLQRSEFAEFWTKKWMDVLRVSRDSIQLQGAQVFKAWLQSEVGRDQPLSEIVSAMLTSEGESYKDPATNYFCVAPLPREVTDADYFQKDLAESTAQLFLGIRLQCAQCHNHPFERWTQDDYLGLAAFFSQVKRSRLGKEGPSGRPDRRQIAVQLDLSAINLNELEHRGVQPHFPGQPPQPIAAETDYRTVLVDWLTRQDNPFFAKSIVNRVWFHLHGRGIVEPVDDFRDSNPSANDALLEGLAEYFVAGEYRLKPLIRAITLSRTYQLSSATNLSNRRDNRYFSHQNARPLPAEVLLDAICEVTDIPEQYEIMNDYIVGIPTESTKLPLGTRAVQLPVTDLVTLINSSGKYVRYELHPFLRTFGQPVRRQTCECDRSPGFSQKQALELTVGDLVAKKLSSSTGRLSQMLASGASDQQLLHDLYQRALSRQPAAEAEQQLLDYVQSNPDRRKAWEDVLWTILNSKEFVYQH